MVVLGIETSCDDTGVAIVKASKKGLAPTTKNFGVGVKFKILSNIISSQIKVHQKYGGVVPNLAAREHLKNIEPCLKQAFKEAKVKLGQIDLIAVTIGPGLIPSLLIGVNFAKTLAYKWQKPIVGVNHIEAHIIAALAATNPKSQILNPKQTQNPKSKIQNLFPAIALVVSGGHTQLVLVRDIGNYKILGETRDDAAGECFDKVAKLLNLGYPGGPEVAAEAEKSKNLKSIIYNLNLPRPMIKQKNYDFSFSGLKTAVLYLLKNMGGPKTPNVGRATSHICAKVQQAIIDVLIEKTIQAAKEYKVKTIILSGGVAANKELRKQLESKIQNLSSKIQFLVPPKKLCTDNGAMIAMAGYYNWKKIHPHHQKFGVGVKANANLRL